MRRTGCSDGWSIDRPGTPARPIVFRCGSPSKDGDFAILSWICVGESETREDARYPAAQTIVKAQWTVDKAMPRATTSRGIGCHTLLKGLIKP